MKHQTAVESAYMNDHSNHCCPFCQEANFNLPGPAHHIIVHCDAAKRQRNKFRYDRPGERS